MSTHRPSSRTLSIGRRLARSGPPVANTGCDRWLLSYADFVTLLFALFVVLYASAKVDAATGLQLIQGINRAFVIDPTALPTGGSGQPDSSTNPRGNDSAADSASVMLPRIAAQRLVPKRLHLGQESQVFAAHVASASQQTWRLRGDFVKEPSFVLVPKVVLQEFDERVNGLADSVRCCRAASNNRMHFVEQFRHLGVLRRDVSKYRLGLI